MNHQTAQKLFQHTKILLACALFAFGAGVASADEGMWLLNQPPKKQLAASFDFSPDDAWFLHLQRSAVRLSDGGSASVVSADGLVMTNHHVAFSQISKLSTAERNLVEEGFIARSHDEELPCPDLEALILWEVEDVTERVKAAAAGLSAAAGEAARRQVISEIESASNESTGLHSQVVTLYGGGLYHLYRYKRYVDVRLVMAPHGDAAYFGGDVDNFEFPRFNLDVTFLRLYEDDKPVRPQHHLSFEVGGVDDGDPVFVVGHPGRTQRTYTVDHLRFLRDVSYPSIMQSLYRAEVELEVFASQSEEHGRIANRNLLGVKNGRKGLGGKLRALQNPAIFAGKKAEEQRLRDAVMGNPTYKKQWGEGWDLVEQSLQTYGDMFADYSTLEQRPLGGSRLFGIARTIVRMTAELEKPSGERLKQYRDSNLASVELRLFSPAPIYEKLEVLQLSTGLAMLAETLGGEDPLVLGALDGRSLDDRARQLVQETALMDVEERRRLVDGGIAAVKASDDPMIRLARRVDAPARELHRRFEDEVQSLQNKGYDVLSAARFAVFGDSVYPDATFTLRFSVGRVAGFEQEGETIAPFTDFNGLFERSAAQPGEDFELPAIWHEKKSELDLQTPFNFVSTNDIIGGNSGSPIVDRDGDVVGLIFDGNRYSFVWDTVFSAERGRAVSVDVRGIVESLRTIYRADELLGELLPETGAGHGTH